MAGQGVQHLPIRYPREMPAWMQRWFDEMLRDVFRNMDVRNATEGLGITIESAPDRPATISASDDLGDLFDADFAMAEASALLPNGRVITGEEGVVEVIDAGPGGTLQIGLEEGGVTPAKLSLTPRTSVIGNPTTSAATPDHIRALEDDVVLRRTGGVLGFGKVSPSMIDPAITSTYLVPVANGDADSPEAVFDDTGDFVFAEAETH
jgi:hypothetical protein